MKNELVVQEKNIEDMIYEIRGKQVMLDADLAKLYQCKNGTKDVNKAVKRNINRFPNDFYFQLTKEELQNLRFQFGTTNNMSRSLPYAFTEQGVAMLSSVLHTEIAEKMSVNIMRAFIAIRKYISTKINNVNIINAKLLEHDNRINLLEETFNKLNVKQKANSIFYRGQIFDAYVVMMEILESAKKEIIIIDDYAGKELLKLIKDINKKITIISNNISEVIKKKYESQYKNVKFIKSDDFHDRFIIIDKKILYHCGASFKDLGTKCFAINLIEDNEIINKLMQKILEEKNEK